MNNVFWSDDFYQPIRKVLCVLCRMPSNLCQAGESRAALNCHLWDSVVWQLESTAVLEPVLTCDCLLSLQIATRDISQSIVPQGMNLTYLMVLLKVPCLKNYLEAMKLFFLGLLLCWTRLWLSELHRRDVIFFSKQTPLKTWTVFYTEDSCQEQM